MLLRVLLIFPMISAFSARLASSSSSFRRSLVASTVRMMSQGQDIALAQQTLKDADAICFDVDSTVIQEEGIDVLADHLGQGEAVAALTKQAMEGGLPFQDALQARLDLLQPSKASIQDCLDKNPLPLTPGVAELIELMHAQDKHVYLVSGGFRIMIEPLADVLDISHDRIYANTILFDDAGSYAGFDADEPTSRDMGKPAALTKIKEQFGYECMLMVGDGATDAQAKPPAKSFVGFGGVAVRPAVQKAADWFVMDFADMIRVLKE